MKLTWARTACSHPALSGVSRAHFGDLLQELAPRWTAVRESALHERRGGSRRRAAGAGRKQKLVFPDRLLATLVHLRLGLPHAALAELFDVHRSGRREDYDETHRAIAGLVSDRCARRATRRRTSTEPVPVRTATC
ncbi:transposase family protein [Streptomyces sp. NPDC093149]|uniref:helix-turn-helix domain-containing protein n=1 Tax=Streptomyces sp. NPDC093149 TaxID=3366031 RepID=UPI0037FCB6BC